MSKWLGPILLLGVFLRHDTSQWLPGYTPQAWFYVLSGLWESFLCAILLLFVRSPLATAALWIGILEGMQVSTCRLLTADMSQVPKGANLCDHLTGWHVGAIMTGVYLFIVCPAIGKAWRGLDRRYEFGLGVVLAVVVMIGGNEIAHLVSPIAALLVMAGACVTGIVAYERAT